jgi:hypothetical protein
MEVCEWNVRSGSIIWPPAHWIKKPQGKIMALWEWYVDQNSGF